jgi:Domain of unknown function (DUF4263)
MPPKLFKRARSTFSVDPLVRNLTPAQVEEDAEEYVGLLNACVSEAAVHQFLAARSYFFNGVVRLWGRSPMYSKIRLGSEHEIDFVCFDTGSYGPEWRLIEIEGPKKRLFAKSGEPSAHLLHAIQQVRDWHQWTHDNLDYARKLMPQLDYPLGYVFVGRASELSSSEQRKLRRLAYDNRSILKIHTLDHFAGMARSVLSLVRHGGGWPLPMRALSHRDLSRGLPKAAREWINGSFSIHASGTMTGLRLSERSHSYWEYDE